MRSIVTLGVLLLLFSCTNTRLPGADLPLRELQLSDSGAAASECGVSVDVWSRAAVRCVQSAIAAGQPFHARMSRQGIDSVVTFGVAMRPNGSVVTYVYDSAPCGGPTCPPGLERTECGARNVWVAPDRRAILCEAPPEP